MTTLTVAALQLPLGSPDEGENIAAVSALVEEAAGKGAQVILPPELFSGPYFCRTEDEALFALARPTAEHPSVIAMQALAARLGVAIPTSFFERDGQHYYNTLAMIGPDGAIMGTYRKSHIPDGPGYEEKYYFRPGNTGVRVWQARLTLSQITSLIAGAKGLLYLGQIKTASLSLALPLDLPSVAAAVIGGTSIFGGRGGFGGTIVGALILTVLTSMLTLMQIPEGGRRILFGLIILAVTALFIRLTERS